MLRNLAKERLKAGKPVVGAVVHFAAPNFVEMLGYSGLHWVFIDCEHGAMSEESVEDMVRAAEISGITPIVRPPGDDPHVMLRFLDLGAHGLIIPHIETKEAAEAAVRNTKYYPLGERGVGRVRWSKWGTAGKEGELLALANEWTMIIVLIESAKGVDNLPAILSVKGIDAILIGPSDLSQSLGLPCQYTHPKVREYVDRILDTCVAAKKPVAMGFNSGEEARKFIKRGGSMVYINDNFLVQNACRGYLQTIEGGK
jgi:4-hydroxy-2-oxoheptanedioate aldolase